MGMYEDFKQIEHTAKTSVGHLAQETADLYKDLARIWDKDKNSKGNLADDLFGELKIVGSHLKDDLAPPDAEHTGAFGNHGDCSILQWKDGRMSVQSLDGEYSMEQDKDGKKVEYYAREDKTVTTTPDGKVVEYDGKTGATTTTSPDGKTVTVVKPDGSGTVTRKEGDHSLHSDTWSFDKNHPVDFTKTPDYSVD